MSTDDLCQQFCACLGSDELRSRVYSIEGRVNLFLSTRSSHTAGSLIFHPNCSINIELIELIIDSARFHRHQRPTLERGLSIHPVTLLCCDVNVGKDWNLSHLDWVMGSCEKVGKQFNIKSLMHVHRWSDAILNFINSLRFFTRFNCLMLVKDVSITRKLWSLWEYQLWKFTWGLAILLSKSQSAVPRYLFSWLRLMGD